VLITEYFQQIDSVISDCSYVVETNVIKDRRSLHIGVIEGQLLFTDDSVLHFIEFVNVKETIESYKYSYHYQDCNGLLIFRYDMVPHHQEIENGKSLREGGEGTVVSGQIPFTDFSPRPISAT
jgi:hypothetical protein